VSRLSNSGSFAMLLAMRLASASAGAAFLERFGTVLHSAIKRIDGGLICPGAIWCWWG
jgi:hypothetical protein